jgi:hypothetical protein
VAGGARHLPSGQHARVELVHRVGGAGHLEALGLFGTGVLLIRRDTRYCLTAAATAALLLVDAWLDVTTAAPGAGRIIAIAMAVCAELPLAATCAALAARGFRGAGRWAVRGRCFLG